MTVHSNEYRELLTKIGSTRRKESLLLLGGGISNALAVTVALVLLVSLLETIFFGDSTFRGILALLTLGGSLTSFVIFVMPSLLRLTGLKFMPSLEIMALRIGNVYPDIKDRLCNSIQLIKNLDFATGVSKSLAAGAFENISNSVRGLDFDKVIETDKMKRSFYYFVGITFITAVLFTIFSSSLGAGFYRVVNFNKSFLPPAPYYLTIEPRNATVLRGDNTKITVTIHGKAPEAINLHIRESQQENFDVVILKPDSTKHAYYEINSIKHSVIYFAEASWLNSSVRTEECKIEVTDKPIVRSISGRLTFPGYTKLGGRNIDDQSADISALKGSNAEFKVLSSKELASAKIVVEKVNSFSDIGADTAIKPETFEIPMKVEGKYAFGSFGIHFSGQYYFILTDKENQTTDKPIKYSIVATNDEYPAITLLEPTVDVQLNDAAKLPLKISISDDYGFSGLKLFYRLVHSKYTQPSDQFSSVQIPLLTNEKTAEVPYLWDLNKIDITPEDKYEFYVEVYDNDKVNGPKSSKTQTLTVRLPSLDEVLESADQQQNKAEKDLEKVLKQAEELKKEMEQLNRDLLKNQSQKTLDWKEKKKAEDFLKKQSDMQNKLNDIKKSIDDFSKKLDENKAISPETLEKYMELQKLMQEVQSPELKRLQELMKQAMDKMSPDELQKAMQNYKFNEEQFRKSIERTLKLLKRLQAEQKVDALKKRSDELVKKQDELQKKLENSNPNDKSKRDELASEQKHLQDDLKNMNSDMKDLEKLMKEIGDNMPQDKLKDAEDALNPEETASEMQEAQKNSQNGDFNKAGKNQKNVSKNLKKFSEQMNKLKEEMDNRNKKEVQRKLQKSISDMLQLSKKQENLKDKTKNTDVNSTQFSDLGEEQSQMEDAMSNIANSMYELSEKSMSITPQMGKQLGTALQQMQEALQQLGNRQTGGAMNAQENAMTALNQAAMEMQAMLSSMQSSGSCNNPGGTNPGGQNGSGAGTMERLQQLAQQQQGINQGMQQLTQGNGKLSPEQQGQLGRIASEQGKAQKALEDLAKEQKQFGGQKMALGDLNKIAKEMEEVVKDMQSGNINPETMKRQERILSRLLDASKSMNERDYERKRESTTGKEMSRQGPDASGFNTKEAKSKALQELMQSIQQGYTKDYEELIRKYFEALQNSGQTLQ